MPAMLVGQIDPQKLRDIEKDEALGRVEDKEIAALALLALALNACGGGTCGSPTAAGKNGTDITVAFRVPCQQGGS